MRQASEASQPVPWSAVSYNSSLDRAWIRVKRRPRRTRKHSTFAALLVRCHVGASSNCIVRKVFQSIEEGGYMPIFHGVVERIGGGRVQGDNETVDALEVKGYPEWRTLHGKSYIMDHLRSSVGKQVVVAISGRILVA